MPTPAVTDTPLRGADAVAAWVRRWLIGLLVASYVLAAVFPGPGEWMRGLGAGSAPAAVRFSLVMVSVLLFCGAVSVELKKLRELSQRPAGVAIALAGVWIPPLIAVAAWAAIASAWLSTGDAAALAVGLALAGAMPVANSAVAWTHQSGGSLVWALGLVVLSISVCPWVTPAVMRLMGLTLSGAQADQANLLVGRFTGAVFLVWVLGPTLVGFVTRRVVGAARIDASKSGLTLVSAAALLLLNYANAAGALPELLHEPDWRLLGVTVLAAVTLPLAGVLPARSLARWAGVSGHARTAWEYSLGMKNTGLALGLAGAALGDQPVVVLAILAVTLTQHVVAGVAHTLSASASGR